MLRNYFSTALRNFLRHPVYSFINVSGLVLGLASTTFIMLWIMDELNYDRYHPENDRVFRVMWNQRFSDGRITTEPWTSGLLAPAMKDQIPEVEKATRLAWSEVKLFQYDNKIGYESGNYADEDIFAVLNLKLLEGDPERALPNSNSVGISKKLARKFFNEAPAIGKVFLIDNKTDLVVTAVFEDLPESTTEKLEFILPFEIYIQSEHGSLVDYDGSGWQSTLVKLNDKNKQSVVDLKMAELVKKTEPPSDDTPPPPPFLFSMERWRLYDSFVDAQQSGGRINYVIAFGVLAFFILSIACVNFTNLCTARAANRAKEVGIRKAAGASQKMLVKQFLVESILLSFLSLLISCLLVYLLLPLFNGIVQKQLYFDLFNPVLFFSLTGIALFTGIVAGSYPAFFLSSFKPASVLKGNLQSTYKGVGLRRTLVVFQFSLSLIIIVSAFIINDQISFLRNKNLGFDKNNVIIIRSAEALFERYETFRNDMLVNRSIKSVAIGDAHPMEINGAGYYDWKGKSDTDDRYFNQAHCDYDYLSTLGFTFIQGRNFSRDFPADSSNYIVTKAAADHMGFANPIGEYISIHEDDRDYKGQIIGVIDDFHNLSIKETWQPTVFALGRAGKNFGRWSSIFVRYEPGQLDLALEHIGKVYSKSSPDFPLQYGFVDEDFQKQFKTESTVMNLAFCFTVLAIGISCLGLFGLSAFAAEKRAKEIGIRKVLGASVSQLVVMLCSDISRLMLFAILIGTPISYWIMSSFLETYPYHTQLTLVLFAIPAIALLLLSLSVVSLQSGKAAVRNPIEVLRGE